MLDERTATGNIKFRRKLLLTNGLDSVARLSRSQKTYELWKYYNMYNESLEYSSRLDFSFQFPFRGSFVSLNFFILTIFKNNDIIIM